MGEVDRPYEEIYRGKDPTCEKDIPTGEYDFRVVAVNDIGTGAFSEPTTFYVREQWTFISNHLTLSNNNYTVMEERSEMQTAISNQSLRNFSSWKIKIDRIVGTSGWVGIGIATDQCLQSSFDGTQPVWVCSSNKHVFPTDQEPGISYHNNDVIEVTVDTQDNSIHFLKNGEDTGKKLVGWESHGVDQLYAVVILRKATITLLQ